MQAVYNIAEICAQHGITDVVLSPGSRSAPLTLAFARHPAFAGRVKVIPDERAAAFIGLGIAQATRRPVVLVCTSGSAGLNYAPAVAEAYFQQVPLLVLTADRPPEWIDQLDGQTIRQRDLYGAHAKGAFDFPADTSHADAKWHSARIINEAINLSRAYPPGPVQVNVPLREPFYPKAGEEIGYDKDVKIIQEFTQAPRVSFQALDELAKDFDAAPRVLFVLGQQSIQLWVDLTKSGLDGIHLEERSQAVFIADVISNAREGAVHDVTIAYHDVFLTQARTELREQLRPDLLITCGKSLISKSLKNFLRQQPPKQHWHIQPSGEVADTFQHLTQNIRADPAEFITMLLETTAPIYDNLLWQERVNYANSWRQADRAANVLLEGPQGFFAFKSTFNEFSTLRNCLNQLPTQTCLHLANSMTVRYANILGLLGRFDVEVFANRGTSGIDGCTSTAVGAALAQPDRPMVLLTGDVAFFYDRNAFWHNYPLPNLRVVLFNNHGGGIFRIIDGPRQQPELDEYFETRQALTAENTCRDFGLRYFPVSSFDELDAALPVFFAAEGGAALLEVFTDSRTNAAFFEEYRAAVKTAFS